MGSLQPVLTQYGELITARRDASEPAWLQAQRADAQQRLAERGLPGKHLESWHYSAANLWLQEFAERHGVVPAESDAATPFAGALPAGHTLRFSHGRLIEQRIDAEAAEQIELLPLAQLDETRHAELRDWLRNRAAGPDSLADLAGALAPESWLLVIKAGARVAQPIVISQTTSRAGSHIGQLLVWMQPDSEATLVDCVSATASAGEYLGISHQLLKLERGSRLTYARLHREAASGQYLGVVEATVGRDAQLRLQALASTPLDASTEVQRTRLRNGFYIRLEETGAEVIGRGAFAAAGQQHIDYHFTVDHRGDHGRSDILMQGLANGKSRGVVNGRIYIAANTRANDGHFTSHNLLLSADAEIDAKPELEIYADEVSCAHGATVGQLDEEQLLYLQTRGIDRPAAITLLTEGFLKAGLLDWSEPALSDFFQRQLLAALQESGGSR